MATSAFVNKFGSSLWDNADYDTVGAYEEYAKRLGSGWTADKVYDFQAANNGAMPMHDASKEQSALLGGQTGHSAKDVGSVLANEEFGFGTAGSTGGKEDKGFFSKLLDGDLGAQGTANLGMKGVGLLANLAMLPDAMALNKEALNGAKIQNAAASTQLANHNTMVNQLQRG